MKRMVDICDVECVQADLEKINALVDLLRYTAEQNAHRVSAYQSDFNSLSLNLMNVFDLIYNARMDLEKFIKAAYSAEG